MNEFNEFVTENARLVILKELAQQVDGRLNDAIIMRVLDTFSYKRSKDWLRTQLRAMEELGAIKIHEVGTAVIAEITQTGTDHLERRIIIEGIERPGRGT